jgi:16S rRNA (cytosine967-C5)-methyltransferase
MRLHRNLVYTVIESLKLVFNEGEYADKVVQKALKKDARWGARDRKFVAETIYEMVRWKRLYNEIAGTKSHYSNENTWKNFAVFAILKGYKLPDWNQLQGVPERRIKGKFDELQNQRVFLSLLEVFVKKSFFLLQLQQFHL